MLIKIFQLLLLLTSKKSTVAVLMCKCILVCHKIDAGLHPIMLAIDNERKFDRKCYYTLVLPLASIKKFCGINFIMTSILTEE